MRVFIGIILMFYVLDLYPQKFRTVEKSDTIDYSKINFQSLKLIKEVDYRTFKIFDSIAINSNVFFVGENHTYRAANTNLQIALIEYLHEKGDLRHIIMEFGTARGWIVNEYINSVDSSYGEILRLYSYPEYYHYYQKLRDLNLTFPDSTRLKVKGIDVERFHDTPLKALSLLLPASEPHDSIALNIEALRGIAGFLDSYLREKKKSSKKINSNSGFDRGFVNFNYRSFDSEKTTNTLVEDFFKHENYYKEYLGDTNYNLYKTIIKELYDQNTYEKYSRQPHQYVYRERYMYNKFLIYHAKYPNEKVFGQFGRCHVAEDKQENPCSWYDFLPIVARLNNTDTPWLKDKVTSIAYFYKDDRTFSKSIDENGVVDKLFEHASKMDTVVAIEVIQDTFYFGQYTKYYDYLIYDNRLIEESAEENSEDEDMENEVSGNFAFHFGYQRHMMDLTDLNSNLTNNNYSVLNSDIDKLVFGFQLNSISGFCYSMNIYSAPEQNTYNSIDTMNLSFSSSGMSMDFSWNILNSKYVFLKPQIGFGFTSYNVKVSSADEKLSPELDFFGGKKVDIYTQSNFIIDPSLELILKLRIIGVGLRGGYFYSPFISKWRNVNGDLIPSGSRVISNGLYVQGTVYMMFEF